MAERRVEVSTSQDLPNPKRFFHVLAEVNRGRSPEDFVGAEVYPLVTFLGNVTADKIRSWQQEYGDAPVNRVHLPFSNDSQSAWEGYARIKMKLVEKVVISPIIMYLMGTVENMKALELVRDLEVGEVNAHVSVVEQAANRGTLGRIKETGAAILVENEGSYSSIDPAQIKESRSAARSVEAVRRHRLAGVIYGADHTSNYGIDPVEELDAAPKEYRDLMRVIHIAGSGHHGLIDTKNRDTARFLDYVKYNIPPQVSLCVDLSPLVARRNFKLRSWPVQQEIDYLRETIAVLES